MRTKNLSISLKDIANAKGVNYRTVIVAKGKGEFFIDHDNIALSLLSIAVYMCDSKAYKRLVQVYEKKMQTKSFDKTVEGRSETN